MASSVQIRSECKDGGSGSEERFKKPRVLALAVVVATSYGKLVEVDKHGERLLWCIFPTFNIKVTAQKSPELEFYNWCEWLCLVWRADEFVL